jgi:Saxitoxin biosynthesis operon protein SxtJ
MTPEIFKPSNRMLRQFAGLWIVFFGVSAAVQEFSAGRHTAAIVLGILSITIGPLGLAVPAAIKPIFIGWMVAVYPIGWTISRLILGLMFFGLFTPVASIFRLMGRDALALRFPPAASTYWKVKPQSPDRSQYLRPY